jgi:RHS repeat-associated protein
MEKDDEIYGVGDAMNYKARMQDTRLGRFFTPDPLFKTYPFYSSYQFAGNTPIQAIDVDGKEPAQLAKSGNNGYTTIYLASEHLTRNVGANETLANSTPNFNPNAGTRRLEATGKILSNSGTAVTGIGVASLTNPITAPLAPELIVAGSTLGAAGTVATTTDDYLQSNWDNVGIDVSAFALGKLGGSIIKDIVPEGFKQEAAQWTKDFISDKLQDPTKETAKREREASELYGEKEKQVNTEGLKLLQIKKPEMATTPSDATSVKKPVTKN